MTKASSKHVKTGQLQIIYRYIYILFVCLRKHADFKVGHFVEDLTALLCVHTFHFFYCRVLSDLLTE